MEANTSFILLLSLRITKKSILMNWKPKNTLCTNQNRNGWNVCLFTKPRTDEFVSLRPPLINSTT